MVCICPRRANWNLWNMRKTYLNVRSRCKSRNTWTIKEITLQYQIRNSTTRDLCVKDVVRYSRNRERHWRDHVYTMQEDRIAKWARKDMSQKRRLDRKQIRWIEGWKSESQGKQRTAITKHSPKKFRRKKLNYPM